MFGRSLLILSSTYFWSSSAKFDSSRAMNIIIKQKRKKINESQRLSFFIEKSQELIGLTTLLGVQNRNMKRFVNNAVDRLAKKTQQIASEDISEMPGINWGEHTYASITLSKNQMGPKAWKREKSHLRMNTERKILEYLNSVLTLVCLTLLGFDLFFVFLMIEF